MKQVLDVHQMKRVYGAIIAPSNDNWQLIVC